MVYYTCNGANDRILDHCLARSSVATTPAYCQNTAPIYQIKRPTVHSGSDRIPGLIHQHTSVVVELHNTSIRALHFLLNSDNHGMSDVSSADLVGDTTVSRAVGAEVSLFLDDNHDSVTYGIRKSLIRQLSKDCVRLSTHRLWQAASF